MTQLPTAYQPRRILDLELSAPLADLPYQAAADALPYPLAQALIRLHTVPLGVVELAVPPEGLPAAAVAALVWAALGERINVQLAADGLPPVTMLTPAGLRPARDPLSWQARRAFLADDPPLMSIVVCTRNRANQLPIALDALLALEYPRFELVLVDNAPADRSTADLIRQQYTDGRVRYVREDRPGLSWARNCGIRAARGEYVAFTDDDVAVDRHWLTELARAFRSAPDVVCASGLTLPAQLDTEAQFLFEQFGGFTNGFDPIRHNVRTAPLPDRFYPYNTIRLGTGVNVAYRRRELLELGGFRVELGAGTPARGSEDNEFYLRVAVLGHDMVYQPTAILRHYHRRDYAALQKQVFGYGVGLFPFLLYCIVIQPRRLLFFIGQTPYVLRAILSPSAPSNVKKVAGYPAELRQLERRGQLWGPFALAKSLWKTYQIKRQFGDAR